ncbi:MAG: restriction endonuclease [Ruminiclostridium sp.]|nr:restriction endonuclease [Ruminiclostridium sp.]
MDNLIYTGAGLLILAVIIICAFAFRKNDGNDDIDEMSGTEFEDFIAEALHRSGIEVLELTKGSGDFGADIIVIHEGERTAVQCKRYARPIGVKAVQEAVSAKDYYKCTKAAVVTNSTFTRQARELAQESGVILWDREDVFGFMNTAAGNSPRKRTATLKFHRLEAGELCDEDITVAINGAEYTLPPHKATAVNASAGDCRICIRHRRRRAELRVSLSEETRLFAVGDYKNKPFLVEIR